MELLIKLYRERTSRIGIKYSSRYPAVKPLEELVLKYPNERFTLHVELAKEKMHLELEPATGGQRIKYRDLDFRKELLTQLTHLLQSGMPVEFVHVYMENNIPVIAKAFHKNVFIAIDKMEMVGSY